MFFVEVALCPERRALHMIVEQRAVATIRAWPSGIAGTTATRNKFHLRIKLPQAIWGHNWKPGAPALEQARVDRAANVPENGMPEIKIVTEVAGRVCALPLQAGTSVGEGDDVACVEAMKMEIPVASPAAGKIKSILVSLDDVVAEGQVLAVLET
jgi:biotin carboxyl carrier protein